MSDPTTNLSTYKLNLVIQSRSMKLFVLCDFWAVALLPYQYHVIQETKSMSTQDPASSKDILFARTPSSHMKCIVRQK